MPTKDEEKEVTNLIRSRLSSRYKREDGQVIESLFDGDLSFADLTDSEQVTILEFNVTWKGFTPEQEMDVIGNVISGGEPAEWMNGVDDPLNLERWADAPPYADIEYSDGWAEPITPEPIGREAERVDTYNDALLQSIYDAFERPEDVDAQALMPPIEIDEELERAISEAEASWREPKSPPGWETAEGGAYTAEEWERMATDEGPSEQPKGAPGKALDRSDYETRMMENYRPRDEGRERER